MTGLSQVNRLSNSLSLRPCGCSRLRHQAEEVDDVDEADLQVGAVFAQDRDGGKGLGGWNISRAGHHYVRLDAVVVRGEVPDADALGAVVDCLVHGQVLQVRGLVRDDDVDVVGASAGSGRLPRAGSSRPAEDRCA